MSPTETAYRAAIAKAQAQKAQLVDSAQAAKERISPARLKQDAKDKVAATALDGVAYVGAKVQQRPIAIAAAAGALGLFMARRPIAALLRRLYVRIQDRHEQSGD
ncbi:hypothetical protein [Sphingobium abikonense]|uniref:hypothetical protein n=1 Tax=Sphingobium abikonense TaxID=86193 RepID=UPI000786DF57|nr:hypothetical protein [Sphingobium abikonense]